MWKVWFNRNDCNNNPRTHYLEFDKEDAALRFLSWASNLTKVNGGGILPPE